MILSIFFLFALATAEYAGHQVLRFNVKNEAELRHLRRAVDDPRLDLDLWSHSLSLGDIDIRVPPSAKSKMSSLFKTISHRVLIPDVERVLASQTPSNLRVTKSTPPSKIFENYQPTENYVNFLASQKGAKKVVIGESYKNETIYGIKFGSGKYNIVVHGGIHAREWITPISVTYAAYNLMTDASYSSLLEKFTFTFIPVLNVDGYEYTRTSKRLWRKNVQPNEGTRCFGTDLNRNFGFQWNTDTGRFIRC